MWGRVALASITELLKWPPPLRPNFGRSPVSALRLWPRWCLHHGSTGLSARSVSVQPAGGFVSHCWFLLTVDIYRVAFLSHYANWQSEEWKKIPQERPCGNLEASIWKPVQPWRADLPPSTGGENTVRAFALAERWRPFSPDTFPNGCFWFSLLCLRLNNLFTPWHARCRVYSIKELTAAEETTGRKRRGSWFWALLFLRQRVSGGASRAASAEHPVMKRWDFAL